MHRPRHRLPGLILGLAAVLAGPNAALAQERNVAPGINSHYQNPDYQRWQSIFERDGREVWDRRSDVLAALRLKPGMAVADIGAGTGFYSRMFARSVGEQGKVYSVDIAESFVKPGIETAREEGLNNVVGIVNNQKSVELPPGSIDLAFISDTYHHFEYPVTLMSSLRQALKPGGSVIVIDFIRRQGFSSPWIMGHVRANKAQVLNELEQAGFELAEEETFLKAHYFLRLRKR